MESLVLAAGIDEGGYLAFQFFLKCRTAVTGDGGSVDGAAPARVNQHFHEATVLDQRFHQPAGAD